MKPGKIITIIAILVIAGGLVWYFTSMPPSQEDPAIVGEYGFTSRSLYTDPYELHNALEVLKYEYDQDILSKEQAVSLLEGLIRELEGSDTVKDFYPVMNTVKKGEICGAVPDENPIGGGKGYTDIIKKGKFNVSTADELVEALGKVKSGDIIFIKGDAKIDMTEFNFAENYTINLPDNVTLAGDRGVNGSKGGMIFTTAIRARPLIQAGENVRITGLCIQGPDPNIRDWKNKAMCAGITTESSGVIIDNCEISGFNFAAIQLTGGENHRIHHNYIHHNRSINVGYGVYVDGATATVEYNILNYNRNSVAGSGKEGTGLVVCNNIQADVAYEHCIAMKDPKSKNSTTAGDYLKIYNNTFYTRQAPFYVNMLPSEGFEAFNNYFAQTEKELPESNLFAEVKLLKQPNVTFKSNAYGLAEKVPLDVEEDQSLKISEYAKKHTPDMRLTDVTSRIYYCDLNEALESMEQLLTEFGMEKADKQTMEQGITRAVRIIEGYDRAYEFLERPNITIDGKIYGAIPDDQPLGGGYGYKEIFTTGDYVVETAEDLMRALIQAKEGQVVFIKGDAVIDMTVIQATMIIRQGVTLASDRGNQGSTGALIYSDTLYSPIFTAYDNARITGLTIRGADPEPRIEFHKRCFSGDNPKGSSYYYRLNTNNGIDTARPGLTVDNCELAGFSHAAINLSSTDHYIHHNYIHHNQRNGLGYGVCHGKAISLIEYNLMNYNRHDIAGTGASGSGYEARNNLQMGASLSHCFDMHGGSDRGDGTNIAGNTILMHHNTFLSDKYPYWLRGIPETIQDFYNNAIYPSLESYEKFRLYGSNDAVKAKVKIRDNAFNLKDDPTVVP